MLIDIVTCICIIMLTIKVILLEIKLNDIQHRNDVQHRRYERDIMVLSKHSLQLCKKSINSIYGKLAYMDTDSIKVEKED
mgnify:CR=1 FL=1